MRTLVALVAVAGVTAAGLAVAIARDDGDSARATIPQPPLAKLNARTRRRLAPASQRVDLAVPSFSSRSTAITNPLFPISELRSAILLGKLDGAPWRAETTLLPRTQTVPWHGMRVQTRLSQFVAYLRGRVFEVALDRYAQADDGSVWYFGEDAYTYEHGRIADREGTWLAGVDGPPAMIMPAHPHVGDVYRTENIPGLVFEEVTVEQVGRTVNGPFGPVRGALIGRELHMDEARLERKTFAPGYGEFFSGGGRTFEATALAVPVDAASGPMPPALERLPRAAIAVFEAVRAGKWTGLKRMRIPPAPKRLRTELRDAVAALARAIRARESRRASLAALDVANASLDLQLRYRPSREIDLARRRLWKLRLAIDTAAGDQAAARGDAAVLRWIGDRL